MVSGGVVRCWCVGAVAALLVSCSSGGGTTVPASIQPTGTTPASLIRLVVDTDLAADDVIALAYLASDPRVELLAVTVAGTGEVSCPRGAQIAADLLVALGRPDVPVGCGAPDPLDGDRRFPAEWRALADDAWGLELPDGGAPGDTDAVSLLIEKFASEEPLTVLTLGPLTNIAQALLTRRGLATSSDRVVVMGGAFEAGGNVVPDQGVPLDAEWNFYIDPTAAAAVVTSGVPLTLVPLDASNGVPVTDSLRELLTNNNTRAATDIVRQLLERYPPPYLWDPLAAITVTDPALVPTRAARVEVILDGESSGTTIENPTATTVTVAEAPRDTDALFVHLVHVLAGVDEDSLVTPTTVAPAGEVLLDFDGTTCTYTGPRTMRAGTYLVDLAPQQTSYWGVVAQLKPSATMDEAVAWINANPDQRPPMVDDLVTIGPGVLEPPGPVEFRPGPVGLACVTADQTVLAAATIQIDTD